MLFKILPAFVKYIFGNGVGLISDKKGIVVKKTKGLLWLFAWVLSCICTGGIPKQEFNIHYIEQDSTGIFAEDIPVAFKYDSKYNLYITGVTDCFNYNRSVATIKYDGHGNQQWVSKYRSPDPMSDHIFALDIDPNGYVYIAGGTENRVNSTQRGMFVIKYDANGKEIWINRSKAGMGASALLLTRDQSVYVGGDSFDPKTGYSLWKYDGAGKEIAVHLNASNKPYNWATTIIKKDDFIYIEGEGGVAKYTLDGKLVWAKEGVWLLNQNQPDVVFTLKKGMTNHLQIETRTADDNLLWNYLFDNIDVKDVADTPRWASDRGGNIYIAFNIAMNNKAPSILLSKFSENGRLQWQTHHKHSESSWDIVKDLQVDDGGNVFVVDYNAGKPGDVSLSSSFYTIAKYSTDGEQRWSTMLDPWDYEIKEIRISPQQDLYVMGRNKGHFGILKYSQVNEFAETPKKGLENTEISRHVLEKPVEGQQPKIELSADQKAYASRMYEYLITIYRELGGEKITDKDIVIPEEMFETQLYRTWGLGPKREFSLEEKYYIMNLQQVDRTWQMYQSIDLSNLTSLEREYLDKIHGEYGKGPVNLRQKTLDEKKQIDPQQKYYFDLIKAVTGSDALDDRGLVMSFRMTPR